MRMGLPGQVVSARATKGAARVAVRTALLVVLSEAKDLMPLHPRLASAHSNWIRRAHQLVLANTLANSLPLPILCSYTRRPRSLVTPMYIVLRELLTMM